MASKLNAMQVDILRKLAETPDKFVWIGVATSSVNYYVIIDYNRCASGMAQRKAPLVVKDPYSRVNQRKYKITPAGLKALADYDAANEPQPPIASEPSPQPNTLNDDNRLENIRMAYYDERTKAQEMGASYLDYKDWLEQCMLKQLDFAAHLQAQLVTAANAHESVAVQSVQDRLALAEAFGLNRDDVLSDDMEDTLKTIKAQLVEATAGSDLLKAVETTKAFAQQVKRNNKEIEAMVVELAKALDMPHPDLSAPDKVLAMFKERYTALRQECDTLQLQMKMVEENSDMAELQRDMYRERGRVFYQALRDCAPDALKDPKVQAALQNDTLGQERDEARADLERHQRELQALQTAAQPFADTLKLWEETATALIEALKGTDKE